MDEHKYTLFDATIKTPSILICSGAPMAGKSSFCLNLLKHAHNMFDKKFDNVIWFYGERSKTIDEIQSNTSLNIQTVDGLPEDVDPFIVEGANNCFIFDDLQSEVLTNPKLTSLFSKKCHHRSVTIFLIVQNLFYNGRERLSMFRCAHYLCIFQSHLDKSQIYSLAHKILPGKQKLFIKIFEAATNKPNGYLFLDGHQHTPPEARFRTDLFEGFQKVFIVNY